MYDSKALVGIDHIQVHSSLGRGCSQVQLQYDETNEKFTELYLSKYSTKIHQNNNT